MRICHLSDSHGTFPSLLGAYDVIVHTGDMSPNFYYDSKEASLQMYWWEEHIEHVKKQVQNHPFLFTLGNHDFINGYWLEGLLNSNGIQARCLHDQIYTHQGVNFYGFPYIPPINGKYAYESTTEQMAHHLQAMGSYLNNSYVDVIAAHAPPSNYLDLDHSNNRYGNSQMNSFLDYTLQADMVPKYYLCGHIHSSCGLMMRGDMLISNAALSRHILEI